MSGASPLRRFPYICGLLMGSCPFLIMLVIYFCTMIPNYQGPPEYQDPSKWVALARRLEVPQAVVPPAVELPSIDPSTPLAALLPTPPNTTKAPLYLGDDLACVPELMLENTPHMTTEEWQKRKAHTAAAALHLNAKKEDGFLEALLSTRPDLAGLPFAMGDACRTTGEQAKAFKEAATAVLRQKAGALLAEVPNLPEEEENRQQFYQAHLAVVNQVIPAEASAGQNSLIRALASIPRPEATRALARQAVFSNDEAVRTAAIEALAVRRESDSTEVLVRSLRYPWPTIADNAATAIARLKRKDLVPQLEVMLDAPDPRGPRTEVVAGQEQTVAPELVRVNHLRNCLLCHAPAERGKTQEETLVVNVPVPTEPLPTSRYYQSESHLLVRVDVTYLRQDFSAMQNVTDWSADTWSKTQRFDFVVRKRVLTPAEADDLRTRLAGVSPYQRAAARALRELTGRDFAPRSSWKEPPTFQKTLAEGRKRDWHPVVSLAIHSE